MKKIFNLSVTLMVASLVCLPLFASATGTVPVDGGISFLVAAGVSYGIKKSIIPRKKEEKKHAENELFI
jgi:hypothetical protein